MVHFSSARKYNNAPQAPEGQNRASMYTVNISPWCKQRKTLFSKSNSMTIEMHLTSYRASQPATSGPFPFVPPPHLSGCILFAQTHVPHKNKMIYYVMASAL